MCLINAEIKPYARQRLGGGDVRFIFHRNEYANKLQILASLDEYIAPTSFVPSLCFGELGCSSAKIHTGHTLSFICCLWEDDHRHFRWKLLFSKRSKRTL